MCSRAIVHAKAMLRNCARASYAAQLCKLMCGAIVHVRAMPPETFSRSRIATAALMMSVCLHCMFVCAIRLLLSFGKFLSPQPCQPEKKHLD